MPARHKRVRDESFRAVQAGTRAIDALLPKLQREIAIIEQNISAPPRPTNPVEHMAAAEIRSRLSSMKPDDRTGP